MIKRKFVSFLLLSAALLAACSNTGTGSETQDSALLDEISRLKAENTELSERVANYESLIDSLSEEEQSEQTSTGSFSIGDSASFDSLETITVTEIKADDSIELMDKADGEHAVVVTATVENASDAPIDFNAQVFDLYDGNNELANFDASTYSNNIPNSIAAGKKATVVMHFSAKGNAPYSVTYGPATWSE